MSWVNCTDESGQPIYVNLALAIQVKAQGNSTIIHFVDGKDVIVRERPEDIVPFTTMPTT